MAHSCFVMIDVIHGRRVGYSCTPGQQLEHGSHTETRLHGRSFHMYTWRTAGAHCGSAACCVLSGLLIRCTQVHSLPAEALTWTAA